MTSRETYYSELEQLYTRLDSDLPKSSGNPCGTCKACCTATVATRHQVTALELDYIEYRGTRVDAFRRFLARTEGIDTCPFYQNGCTVYKQRPVSCRLFGHYRSSDTAMPEVCVFRGQEHIFQVADYQNTVPEAEQLLNLSRAYWAHRVQRSPIPGSATGPQTQDAVGKALEQLAAGDIQSAFAHFRGDWEKNPFNLYAFSLVAEPAGRPDLACQALGHALQQAPASPDLWFRLGCVLFALNDRESSMEAFARTVEFYPEHGEAWGMLGMHHLLKSQHEEAIDCLEKAVLLRPHDQGLQRRLETTRQEAAQQKP